VARVVVTGGLGFIGSRVVRELASDYEVVVVDDCSRAKVEVGDMECSVMRVSVLDYEALLDALTGAEAVLHLAALIDVEESLREPLKYHEVNVTGTLNVLLASVERGVGRVVYASSAAVYGEPRRLPVSEDHPADPLSVYGATKLAGEQYCRVFSRVHGLDVTVLRIFNVYGGEWLEYSGVISSFARRLARNEPLIIYGDGSQTRDFVYVDDVAKSFRAALAAPPGYTVYNVGTGKPTSVRELAELMMELSGRHVGIIYRPKRPGDIRHSYADIGKIERELGWSPKIPLREGLEEVVKHFVRADERS